MTIVVGISASRDHFALAMRSFFLDAVTSAAKSAMVIV
jgi:hypothetical protein